MLSVPQLSPSSVLHERTGLSASETSRLPGPADGIVDGLGTSLHLRPAFFWRAPSRCLKELQLPRTRYPPARRIAPSHHAKKPLLTRLPLCPARRSWPFLQSVEQVAPDGVLRPPAM